VWDAALGRHRNLAVDVGKFFWHAALDVFPRAGIRSLDAVLLTHNHNDACGGLDDLRDFTGNAHASLPVYARQVDLDHLRRVYYWIFGDLNPGYDNYVTELRPVVIDSHRPFVIRELGGGNGLTVTPLPVWHGRGFESLGFLFGRFAYISDISACPPATLDILMANSPLEALVLDCCERGYHPSHFSLDRAIEFAAIVKPRRLLLTGFTHEYDHDSTNRELAEWSRTSGIPAECAYDGMCIELDSL
jgi:phosphoribosyl 1,2-cyclic phosphodiesterase